MKRNIKILIIIIVLYLLFNLGIKIFSKGHEINYILKIGKNKFEIKEKYIMKIPTEFKGYKIIIKINKTNFNIQTLENFKRRKKIVKNIKYYKDNKYECILPIFENNISITDVICIKDKKMYNYTDINGEDKKLDKFVNNIKEYSFDNYKDKLIKKQKIKNIVVYQNIDKLKDFIVLDNYKGVFLINNKQFKNIKLFNEDKYKKKIVSGTNKYYLIADYDEKYEFHNFNIIDITNGEKKTIVSNNAISHNSYIQGINNNKIYLFDKSNMIQYEIDIKKSKVNKVGDKNTDIIYYNLGVKEKISVYEAKKEKRFNYYHQKNENYEMVDKIGGEKLGYNYYYKKVNDVYYVYRSYNYDKSKKQYLFTTDDLDHIIYKNDYIFYIHGKYLKVYNDKFGNKTIFKNSELKFNKTLNFYVY